MGVVSYPPGRGTAVPIFNLDGTINDDFRIGKKGPRIRQGEATPTSGANGDLYLQHGTAETARLWHRRSGAWQQLADQAYVDGLNQYAAVNYTISDTGSGGDIYAAGHYDAPAVHFVFWEGVWPFKTLGTAGNMQGAHAFFVAGLAGTPGLVLTVTGTSIDDAGIRTTSDSEILVAEAGALSMNDYVETTKRWLGQVTYTIRGSPGGFFIGNLGLAAYETFGDRDFTVKDFKADGYGGAATTDADFQLIHHSSAGWTYHASAFRPGGTVLASAASDVSTDGDFVDGNYFHYERVGLNTDISGSTGDGIVIRYTAAAADSLRFANIQLGYLMAATT